MSDPETNVETLARVILDCLKMIAMYLGIARAEETIKADAMRWAHIWSDKFQEFDPRPAIEDIKNAFRVYYKGAVLSKEYPEQYVVFGNLRSIMRGKKKAVPVEAKEPEAGQNDELVKTAWRMATGRVPVKPEHHEQWEQFGRREYCAAQDRRKSESASKGIWRGGRQWAE